MKIKHCAKGVKVKTKVSSEMLYYTLENGHKRYRKVDSLHIPVNTVGKILYVWEDGDVEVAFPQCQIAVNVKCLSKVKE